MSFAITKFKAYGIRASGSTRKHASQIVSMAITALNTDVTCDIASMTTGSLGTFWTAVIADATYGSLGISALAVMQAIQSIATRGYHPLGETLSYNYYKVASGASGLQYTSTVTSHMPTITFVSGSAPTGFGLELRWDITDGLEPYSADLGAANT